MAPNPKHQTFELECSSWITQNIRSYRRPGNVCLGFCRWWWNICFPAPPGPRLDYLVCCLRSLAPPLPPPPPLPPSCGRGRVLSSRRPKKRKATVPLRRSSLLAIRASTIRPSRPRSSPFPWWTGCHMTGLTPPPWPTANRLLRGSVRKEKKLKELQWRSKY